MILVEKTKLLQYRLKQSEWWQISEKLFFKFNKFSSFQIKNKWFSSYEDHDPGKKCCLYSKALAKLSPRSQKLYQITCIFSNPLWAFFIQPFDTNLSASTRTLGLQWSWRAQLCIQKTRLHCCLPWNYLTNLLAYFGGQFRIIFNYLVKKLGKLKPSFSNSDTSWKNNTPIISTETLRIVIYLWKIFL